MNLAAINEGSPALWDSGQRLLHTYRFASTDGQHIRRLLQWADIPVKALVIDLGCGFGEVARMMQKRRNDIHFTLVNTSLIQLEYAPKWMRKLQCNFLSVPQASHRFDTALHIFSLGFENFERALHEAYRLLRKGGSLFILDMVRVSGDNTAMYEAVQYAVPTITEWENLFEAAGFEVDFCLFPTPQQNLGPSICGSEAAYEAIFHGTIPVVWRLTKPASSVNTACPLTPPAP